MSSSLGYHNFYGLFTVIKHHFQVSLNYLKIKCIPQNPLVGFLTEIQRHKRKMLATWKPQWMWTSCISLITNLLPLSQEEAFIGILFSLISECVFALLLDTTQGMGQGGVFYGLICHHYKHRHSAARGLVGTSPQTIPLLQAKHIKIFNLMLLCTWCGLRSGCYKILP